MVAVLRIAFSFLVGGGRCGSAFNFGNIFRRQLKFAGAHDAFGLFGVARANNRASNDGFAESPGDSDFAGSA